MACLHCEAQTWVDLCGVGYVGVVNGSDSKRVEDGSNKNGSNGIVVAVAQMVSLRYECPAFPVKSPLNAQPRLHPRSSC